MELRLLVIRTNEMEKLVDFYAHFDLQFEFHQHGNSPLHYSTLIGTTVLEIYPLAQNQSTPDKNLRIGFALDNFEEIIQKLKEKGVKFNTEPRLTDFGFMAVVEDTDGRKVELYKK